MIGNSTTAAIKGGEFLVRETNASEVFVPEMFNEEQLMVADSALQFLQQEIYPRLDDIDSHSDPDLVPSLLTKAADLGLLSSAVPEQFGGLGMDFITNMLLTEVLGRGHAFAVSIGAHTGIGTLPILYYGNEAQKHKYLPKLANGEWKAAYCLTEPDSGSDANSGKTKAVLNAEGTHYIINGQKMWITNGGFAEVFTVFAKIDDDPNLSAFIVEKSFGGITMNNEEHKMGIKGSSTRQIFFNDCKVPKENLLSDRGNGFKIAVNILNIGRIKLAAACIGGSKQAMTDSRSYANERKQFGQPIGSFGAIKQKIAQQYIRTYVSESACYRASQNIDDAIHSLMAGGMEPVQARIKGVEQFAIECAIMKVHSSEVLDYVVDEGVQIYGGMGYSADAPMERSYRDSRINRIFEGTNEINRMLAVGTLLKRAMKGEIDLLKPAMGIVKELTGVPEIEEINSEFDELKSLVKRFKKTFLMTAGAAAQKFGAQLEQQQEVMMALADMMIETYVTESAMLRAEKLVGLTDAKTARRELLATLVYANSAAEKIASSAKKAVNSFAENDELRMMHLGIKRFTKTKAFNLIQAEREIADDLLKSA